MHFLSIENQKRYHSKIAGLEIPVQKPNAKHQCNGMLCTSIHP